MRRIKVIMRWVLVLLLVRLSQQDGHPTGVSQCGPQNLTVSQTNQMVLVKWEDDTSCSALNVSILYKLTVLIENKEVHSDEVSVAPDDIGSTHSWSWTSHLPLECASHTFRLKSQINNQMSQLEQEKTLHGETGSGMEKVFPQDAVLEAGSIATFCCIVPEGEHFLNMELEHSKRNKNITKISEQRYAMTLQLEPVRDVCVAVLCHTRELRYPPYGSCVYIGYPPDDRDLRCETRDLESVECLWNEGRDTLVKLKSPTVYQLDGSPCKSTWKGRCSKKLNVEGGEKTWTLTAWNKLGKVEIQDTADLTRRVHMFAPHELKIGEVNARNASLTWRWTVQQYNNLNLTCQINISDTEGYINHGVGLNATVLTGLRPNWKYEVKVRCGTAQHFWKWGDWSQSVSFRTEGQIPDALDVWMKEEENQTEIAWKMLLDNQSHGDITGYEVTWTRTSDLNQLKKTKVDPGIHRYPLSLDTSGEYVVTITAMNKHGSSPPSTIIIPVRSPEKTSMKTFKITGSNGGFDLSWSRKSEASCGYIVEWFPVFRDEPVDWLKLPPSQTSVRITPKNFRDGQRYSLSIYACTRTSPLLLEKKEGYVTETRIQGELFKSLRYKQQGSNVEISWDPVPLREQTAFISGYVLYCRNKTEVFSVTTDNPEHTRLTVGNLTRGSYIFTVVAQTAVGECGNTTITATINFESSFISIFVSLGAVFTLLLLITVFCFRYWACIKEKVYPQIPKPDMADWFTTPVENLNPHHHTDLSRPAEEIMDVPELHYKSGELLNNNTYQEDMALISSQTPPRYKNHPVQHTGDVSSVFPNLTYNLPMGGEDRPPGSGPKQRLNSEYQPQILAEIFRQNQTDRDPVTCVSEYIMAPQPSLSQ
ncbi:oncostatin-M-specific receptor subunit beta-like [Anableps anableps]